MSEQPRTGAEVQDISLRRLQQVAEENRELKSYVAEVMKRLRENELLFSRLFRLEAQVLAASDPEDLCFSLMRGLRSGFDLDMVRFWFDRTGVMGGHKMEALSERDLIWLEAGEIRRNGLDATPVRLQRLTAGNRFAWLEGRDEHLGSLALLTLGSSSAPFGVLGLGSIDPSRFAPDQSSAFLQHLAQVVGLTLENAVSRERLAMLAVTDSLTGSHNRRFLQPYSLQPLSQLFGRVPVACLYLDLDGFKAINDIHGHALGDEVLAKVSEAVRALVRGQDPLVRMGGDEFVLLLPGCGREKAIAIAGKALAAVADVPCPDRARLGVSIGLAFSDVGEDKRLKQLIEEADQAMYVAKALGGGRFELAAGAPTSER